MISIEQIASWNQDFAQKNEADSLYFASKTFPKKLTFACSFGLEDMLILDTIVKENIASEIFYLDTGRLHDETYQLISDVERVYGKILTPYFPNPDDVESYVKEFGINGFYDGVPQRLSCCEVRKVRPLQRALKGKTAWITGLRRQQSAARANLQLFELDKHSRVKISPLWNWSWEQLKARQKELEFPMNSLHKRGFSSIGCAPCTRPIPATADFREGRWWWEQNTTKECGLHSYK